MGVLCCWYALFVWLVCFLHDLVWCCVVVCGCVWLRVFLSSFVWLCGFVWFCVFECVRVCVFLMFVLGLLVRWFGGVVCLCVVVCVFLCVFVCDIVCLCV